MKTVSIFLLLAVAAMTLACGYGSKNYNTTPAAGTKPAIAQLSPDNTTAGGPDFVLDITGSHFNSNAVINWNGGAQTAGTTYVSSGEVKLAVTSAMIASSGAMSISVTNPGTPATGGPYGNPGTSAATSTPVTFTVNP